MEYSAEVNLDNIKMKPTIISFKKAQTYKQKKMPARVQVRFLLATVEFYVIRVTLEMV